VSDVLQAQRVRVGRQIRAARLAAGLSHDALGAIVGTSRQHLIKLEKGIHAPRPEMLTRIAEATRRPASFFEGDLDAPLLDEFAALGETIADALRNEVTAAVRRAMAEREAAVA
jgi:transcriptional regulator with XRE-family HTH domain